MKVYVRKGDDLVEKSSTGGGVKSIQLTGVITSNKVAPNANGDVIIPTSQIYSGRALRSTASIDSNAAGNYKIATFHCQYSNCLTLKVQCGMIVNHRWDIGFRKNNPTEQKDYPSDGKFQSPTASLTVFNGAKYNSIVFTVNQIGVKLLTNTANTETEVWLTNVPMYHFGLIDVELTGEAVHTLDAINISKPGAPTTTKG
jgi:hypothetical protein